MKLVRITLAPFAGVRDKTYEFTDGLNVVFGPNEFGKSTLFSAITAALFIPVKLGKHEFKTFEMGRHFPSDGGTRVKIHLEFKFQGELFTLIKEWNNSNGSCKGNAFLTQQNGTQLTDELRVQEKLDRLTGLNYATWKNVLFTRQAQLDATIDLLRENKNEMISINQALSAGKGIDGDVDPDKLRVAIEAKIESYYSRWDEKSLQPEKGKGIENPWLKEVGVILDAYYKKENLAAKLKIITEHEKQLGSLAKRIAELQLETDEKSTFITANETAFKACTARFVLETELKGIRVEMQTGNTVAERWPVLKASVEEKEKLIPALEKNLADIKVELDNARKRDQGTALLKDFQQIKKEKEELNSLQENLATTIVPDPGDLSKISVLEKKIFNNKTAIAAQKLKLRLLGRLPADIELTTGEGKTEDIRLNENQELTKSVEGKFTLKGKDFELQVSNESGDADKLFSELEKMQAELSAVLAKYSVSDVAGVKVLDEKVKNLKNSVDSKQAIYKRLLRDRPFESWEKFVNELSELPAAREVATIEREQEQKRNELAEHKVFVDQNKKQLLEWEEKYQSPREIIKLLVKLETRENKIAEELNGLAALPDGFTDASTFKAQYERFQKSLSALKDELSANKNEESKLMGREQEESAEDVTLQLDIAIRKFELAKKQGAALQRILDKLNNILEQSDKKDKTAERVAWWFSCITDNKYPDVSMSNGLPERISNSQTTLSVDLLSQGTRAGLALALRLAMAEAYLQNSDGFIMMDDPLTDMDAARKSNSAKAFKQLASEKQIFIFTCDDYSKSILA